MLYSDVHVLLKFNIAVNLKKQPGTSGGFSPGASVRQAGLKVQFIPLTPTRTSPVGKTWDTRPT